MKTLRSNWNRGLSWILTTLLGALGFSSCVDSTDEPDDIICMYGTPTAYYTIKGKVTNTTGQSLPNIQVIISKVEYGTATRPNFIPDHPKGSYPLQDTMYTKENGEFIASQSHFPMDTLRYTLKINPDEQNSLYQSDSLKVTFLRKDLDGAKGWNCGNAEKEIKVILNPKKEENNE